MNIKLKVAGMSCGHCKRRVENALAELGIREYSVDLESALVTAAVEPPLTQEQVVEAIKEAGYEPSGI